MRLLCTYSSDGVRHNICYAGGSSGMFAMPAETVLHWCQFWACSKSLSVGRAVNRKKWREERNFILQQNGPPSMCIAPVFFYFFFIFIYICASRIRQEAKATVENPSLCFLFCGDSGSLARVTPCSFTLRSYASFVLFKKMFAVWIRDVIGSKAVQTIACDISIR